MTRFCRMRYRLMVAIKWRLQGWPRDRPVVVRAGRLIERSNGQRVIDG